MNQNARQMTDAELSAAHEGDRECDARNRTAVRDENVEHKHNVKQAHRQAMQESMLTGERLGHLCGDKNSSYGGRMVAPHTKRLRAEHAAGYLKSNDDVRFYRDCGKRGPKRGNPATIRITRQQFLAWVETHGTDDYRASAGAQWVSGIGPDDD